MKERQEAFLKSVADFVKRKPGGRRADKISLPDNNNSISSDLSKELEQVVESYDLRAAYSDLCERWLPYPSPAFLASSKKPKGWERF